MGKRHIIFVILVILLASVLVVPGCREEESEVPPPDRMGLSSTLVPDTDFDVYVYIKQQSPTPVLKDIIGAQADVNVVSMSVWGIAAGETYMLSGGLTFTNSTEAADIQGRILEKADIWTYLSQETIYFVHGSGHAVDAFKSAISADNLKYYDDKDALVELGLFPDSAAMKLIGVAVARPTPTLVGVIVRNTPSDVSEILDILLKRANLKIVTAGLYSQRQVDISAIAADPELANILEAEVGILASAVSELPGLVVGPIVKVALETAGYEETVQDGITMYSGYLELGLDEAVPVFFRVEDNRLFVAVSLQESYARLLISNVLE
jgi:hypothetical protein